MAFDDPPIQPTRASCLPVMLGCGTIGFMGLLLTVATGGGFMWFIGALFVMLCVGAVHYVLWGHMMTEQAQEPPTESTDPQDERITR